MCLILGNGKEITKLTPSKITHYKVLFTYHTNWKTHNNYSLDVWLGLLHIKNSILAKFPFQYSPWDQKIGSHGFKKNWLKKFMQVEVDVKCMHTKFGGCGHFGIEDFAPFNFSFGPWTLVL